MARRSGATAASTRTAHGAGAVAAAGGGGGGSSAAQGGGGGSSAHPYAYAMPVRGGKAAGSSSAALASIDPMRSKEALDRLARSLDDPIPQPSAAKGKALSGSPEKHAVVPQETSAGRRKSSPGREADPHAEDVAELLDGDLNWSSRVYAWGNGDKGQLGLGHERTMTKPAPITWFEEQQLDEDSDPIVPNRVAVGGAHTAIVTCEGQLYAFGAAGVCGQKVACALPKRIEGFERHIVADVAAGESHTLVLVDSGHVYAWGVPAQGRLGVGHVPSSQTVLTRPRQVQGALAHQRCIAIACGHTHSAAITVEGKLYTWGSGMAGQLGHGDCRDQLEPHEVAALDTLSVKNVSCGMNHTAAVVRDGRLFTWGWGQYGRLGHSDEDKAMTPTLVGSMLEYGAVKSVACGGAHTLCITVHGAVFAWGWGEFGQLGFVPSNTRECYQPEPRKVPLPPSMAASAVYAGYAHSAVLGGGKLCVWGFGEAGQLGFGSDESEPTPRTLDCFRRYQIRHASLGRSHTAVVASRPSVPKPIPAPEPVRTDTSALNTLPVAVETVAADATAAPPSPPAAAPTPADHASDTAAPVPAPAVAPAPAPADAAAFAAGQAFAAGVFEATDDDEEDESGDGGLLFLPTAMTSKAETLRIKHVDGQPSSPVDRGVGAAEEAAEEAARVTQRMEDYQQTDHERERADRDRRKQEEDTAMEQVKALRQQWKTEDAREKRLKLQEERNAAAAAAAAAAVAVATAAATAEATTAATGASASATNNSSSQQPSTAGSEAEEGNDFTFSLTSLATDEEQQPTGDQRGGSVLILASDAPAYGVTPSPEHKATAGVGNMAELEKARQFVVQRSMKSLRSLALADQPEQPTHWTTQDSDRQDTDSVVSAQVDTPSTPQVEEVQSTQANDNDHDVLSFQVLADDAAASVPDESQPAPLASVTENHVTTEPAGVPDTLTPQLANDAVPTVDSFTVSVSETVPAALETQTSIATAMAIPSLLQTDVLTEYQLSNDADFQQQQDPETKQQADAEYVNPAVDEWGNSRDDSDDEGRMGHEPAGFDPMAGSTALASLPVAEGPPPWWDSIAESEPVKPVPVTGPSSRNASPVPAPAVAKDVAAPLPSFLPEPSAVGPSLAKGKSLRKLGASSRAVKDLPVVSVGDHVTMISTSESVAGKSSPVLGPLTDKKLHRSEIKAKLRESSSSASLHEQPSGSIVPFHELQSAVDLLRSSELVPIPSNPHVAELSGPAKVLKAPSARALGANPLGAKPLPQHPVSTTVVTTTQSAARSKHAGAAKRR